MSTSKQKYWASWHGPKAKPKQRKYDYDKINLLLDSGMPVELVGKKIGCTWGAIEKARWSKGY